MWSCFEASWTRAWGCSEKNVLNFWTSASGVGAQTGAAFLVPHGFWWPFFLQPFVMGTSLGLLKQNMCLRMTSTWWSSVVHRTFPLPKLVNPYWNVNRPENPKWTLGIGYRLQETYLWRTKFNNEYQNDLHLTSLGWHWYIFRCLYISLRHIYFWTFINDHPVYNNSKLTYAWTRVVPDSWVASQLWLDSDSNESSQS